MVDAEINYVEGKMECFGIPIEHAWNEYKGQYFDATREIALKEEVQGREYLALGTFDSDDVLGVIMKRKYYGGILLEKHLQKLRKNGWASDNILDYRNTYNSLNV